MALAEIFGTACYLHIRNTKLKYLKSTSYDVELIVSLPMHSERGNK